MTYAHDEVAATIARANEAMAAAEAARLAAEQIRAAAAQQSGGAQ